MKKHLTMHNNENQRCNEKTTGMYPKVNKRTIFGKRKKRDFVKARRTKTTWKMYTKHFFHHSFAIEAIYLLLLSARLRIRLKKSKIPDVDCNLPEMGNYVHY